MCDYYISDVKLLYNFGFYLIGFVVRNKVERFRDKFFKVIDGKFVVG